MGFVESVGADLGGEMPATGNKKPAAEAAG
jgi:hypothetical protein